MAFKNKKKDNKAFRIKEENGLIIKVYESALVPKELSRKIGFGNFMNQDKQGIVFKVMEI